jgi:hypothetical protein
MRSGWTIISPKTFAATAAGALSILFWTIATATFWKGTFAAEELTALTTSTTTVVAALLAYLVPDRGYVNSRSLVEHPIEDQGRAPHRAGV